MTVLTIKQRLLDLLASEPPLYAGEIADRMKLDRVRVIDHLGRMYREGVAAKAAPKINAECLWTASFKADQLPQRNVHVAVLSAEQIKRREEPPPAPRLATKVNPRAIAHNRSIFDWRP